jgi:hypothetical protein
MGGRHRRSPFIPIIAQGFDDAKQGEWSDANGIVPQLACFCYTGEDCISITWTECGTTAEL